MILFEFSIAFLLLGAGLVSIYFLMSPYPKRLKLSVRKLPDGRYSLFYTWSWFDGSRVEKEYFDCSENMINRIRTLTEKSNFEK